MEVISPWCSGYHRQSAKSDFSIFASANLARGRVGGLRCIEFLTVVPAENKA